MCITIAATGAKVTAKSLEAMALTATIGVGVGVEHSVAADYHATPWSRPKIHSWLILEEGSSFIGHRLNPLKSIGIEISWQHITVKLYQNMGSGQLSKLIDHWVPGRRHMHGIGSKHSDAYRSERYLMRLMFKNQKKNGQYVTIKWYSKVT